jgi:SAM-dependent methyltransferase
MNKLNLGSGGSKKEGYVNIDWNNVVKPDIMHDLNKFPYPIKDNEFDLIEARHVLEHLDKPFEVMKEIHRILKPGGKLIIQVPHFSRGFTHAEHSHGFDVTFPLYFNKKFSDFGYYGVDYISTKIKIKWMAFFHLLPFLGYKKATITLLRILNGFISFIANLSPAFCSRVWCYWLGGFEEIYFEFKCKK